MAIGRNYILLRDNDRSGKIESRAISPYNIIGIMVCLYNANTPFVAAPVIFLYPNNYSTSRIFNHTHRWISILANLRTFLFARHRPLRSRQFYIVTNNQLDAFFIHVTLDIDLRRPWYRNKLKARKILNYLFVNFILTHLLYYCFKFFVELIFPTFRY